MILAPGFCNVDRYVVTCIILVIFGVGNCRAAGVRACVDRAGLFVERNAFAIGCCNYSTRFIGPIHLNTAFGKFRQRFRCRVSVMLETLGDIGIQPIRNGGVI